MPDEPQSSLFISYSSRDVKVANRLRSAIEKQGIRCWMAPRDVPPGENYATAVVRAIEECSGLVLLLSHQSNASAHVHVEVERAFSKKKLIFPVRIDDVVACSALELFVANAQWIEYRGISSREIASRLAAGLHHSRSGGPSSGVTSVQNSAWSWKLKRRAITAIMVMLAAVLCGWGLWAIKIWAEGREPVPSPGDRGQAPVAPPSSIVTDARSVAVVIGIDDYVDNGSVGWPKLSTARSDAEAVGRTLRDRYGYSIIWLLDREATRSSIVAALDSLASLTEADTAVIYFAGHGFYDERLAEGYWIPADARRSSGDRAATEDWVWNTTVAKILRASRARQMLVIADSCFGGSLLASADVSPDRRGPDWPVQALSTRARYVIASGGLETVPDSHSVFAAEVLRYLTAPPTIPFTGSELASAVRERTMTLTSRAIQSGALSPDGMPSGEFVFLDAKARDRLQKEAMSREGTDADLKQESRGAVGKERRDALLAALALESQGATNAARAILLDRKEEGSLARAVASQMEGTQRVAAADRLRELIATIERRKLELEKRPPDDRRATVRPRVLACLGPVANTESQEARWLAKLYRIGLQSELQRLGNLHVVEREALEDILRETSLAASDLSDPAARPEIGKLLPAGLLLLGDMIPGPDSEDLFVRVVETETGRVVLSIGGQRRGSESPDEVCSQLASQIVARVVASLPLRAPVLAVDESGLSIGIGSFQGAREGSSFIVLQQTSAADAKIPAPERLVGKGKVEAPVGDTNCHLRVIWSDPSATNSPTSLVVSERPGLD